MRRRARVNLAVMVTISALIAVSAYVLVHSAAEQLPEFRLPLSQSCAVAAADGAQPVALDGSQMANAATISAVGLRRGVPRRAVVVALATAWQESDLENLPDGDRDSIGLFQQRPSQGWGSPEQIGDPRYAAGKFYTSLLKVKGWQEMRVTDAAQAVQRSAFPEAYEKWAAKAEVLARALVGEATGAVGCSFEGDPASRGPAAAETLLSGLKADWGEVRTVKVPELVGLALPATDSRAGWQYAHWLVAHAEARGIQRVRYGDMEWTAKAGQWAKVTQSVRVGSGERVEAEVFPG